MRHSPSSLRLFDACPHRFYRERILMDLDPTVVTDTRAADRGRSIHEQLELAVLGKGPWPEGYPLAEEWYRDIIKLYPTVAVERKLALDRDLKPTGFDFSDCWIRGIADLILWNGETGLMRVVDYKTGKRRKEGAVLQMKFYALACLTHSDKVRHVTTDLYWLGYDQHDLRTYSRLAIPDLQAYITEACTRVESELDFPKRKSGLCRGYCPVSDCEHFRPAAPDFSADPVLSFTKRG